VAIELSKYMLIAIDTGAATSPGGFTDLGNQVNGALSMSANQIDAANKTSEGWAPTIAGLRQFQITADGQADPTDTALAALIAYAIAGSSFLASAVLYSTGSGYQATVQPTQMEINGPSQQPTQWRTTMSLSTGAPSALPSP
jgi:predicted secreted protein